MKFVNFAAVALSVVVSIFSPAQAQTTYPSKMITIVVPITSGTTLDILARLYADALSKKFNQQVVVLNRPGAGGLIAAQAVAAAPADGYTLLFANSGHAILGALNKNLPFDPIADFSGIALVGDSPTVVNVAPSLGVKNLKEFVALAQSKPGSLNYGSAGLGTATHLAGAYFALQTKIDLVHVPYTVSSAIIADLLGGRIQAMFTPAAASLPLLQDGRLMGLAVGAEQPVSDPINVVTAKSEGFDYINTTWYGLLAPTGTPKSVKQVLYDAIADVGNAPDLQAKIRGQVVNPRIIGLGDFDVRIREDMTRLGPLLASIASSK